MPQNGWTFTPRDMEQWICDKDREIMKQHQKAHTVRWVYIYVDV
jgi:hypothetical protein